MNFYSLDIIPRLSCIKADYLLNYRKRNLFKFKNVLAQIFFITATGSTLVIIQKSILQDTK